MACEYFRPAMGPSKAVAHRPLRHKTIETLVVPIVTMGSHWMVGMLTVAKANSVLQGRRTSWRLESCIEQREDRQPPNLLA
jgi:hypothetical protein